MRPAPIVRRLVDVGLAAAALVLLVASASPWLGALSWSLDFPSFFLPALLLADLLLLAVALLLRRRVAAVVLGLAIVAAGLALFGNPAPNSPDAPGKPLRVVSFNVLIGNGRTAAFERFVREEQPDVLLLQELWTPWYAAMERMGELYPYSTRARGGPDANLAIFSRLPLADIDVVPLMPRVAGGARSRVAVTARLVMPGGPVLLVAIHPSSPRNAERWGWRNQLLEGLRVWLLTRPPAEPRVVGGDTNTPPWSYWWRRLLREADLRDTRGAASWRALPTRIFGNRARGWWGTPIDQVAVSPDIAVSTIRRGPDLGSDHRPVIVDLVLPSPPPL